MRIARFAGIVLAGAILFSAAAVPGGRGTFAVKGDQFLLNGKPFRILSGELHYPRIPRAYWKDRLLKARAMGLNTVCTYLFWNWHEPEPGKYRFDGDLDVAEFIRQAQEAGLNVLIRPGPYVCSEWDFGGLPAWLLRDPEIRVRCMDPAYLKAVARYVGRIGRELAGLQITRGGPILMLQVENEYGSYGNDEAYMRWLRDQFRAAGFEIPFFTSDGGAEHLLASGAVDGATPVVNFGGNPEGEFAALERFRPGIPQMNGEFWCGWFTHWGNEKWGGSDLEQNVKDLEWMLATGRSFNLYMFHGGTNFGWSAGANWDKGYRPDITSYDYDAPLDESGNPTEKYLRFRELIGRYQPAGTRLPDLPVSPGAISLPPIRMTGVAELFSNLPPSIPSPGVRSMEAFGLNHGFVLYRTKLRGPKSGTLRIEELHDIGWVYLDGRLLGRLDRRLNQNTIEIPAGTNANPVLSILVEGMGRINFGAHLLDRKGITQYVTLRGVTLTTWEIFPLPLDEGFRSRMSFHTADTVAAPAFFRGEFTLRRRGDTFLDMSGWSKGVVWVNGKNLGRYWSIGPQQRLFLPAPWLIEGRNEIVVFDPEATGAKPVEGLRAMRDAGPGK